MKTKKRFRLDDVIPGGKSYSKFVSNNLEQLQWIGDVLIFIRENKILLLSPETLEERTVCTLKSLNNHFYEKKIIDHDLKEIPPFISLKNEKGIQFRLEEHIVDFNLKTNKIARIIESLEWKDIDYCEDNDCFAFTKDNDLWISSASDRKRINGKSESNVIYGQAVHRHEFGIKKGTFWSPNGRYLAFYRMDESMVSDYELIDNSTNPPQKRTIKYPSVGEASHEVSIGIYSIETSAVTYLNTGSPYDRYFTNLAWSPDEKELYIVELNRDQNECALKAYNIATGNARTLFTESSSTYIDPQNPPLFTDENHFVWQSERNGHNHFYLYNAGGELLKTITQGDWDILELINYNKKSKQLIFASTETSPLDKCIYSIHIESSEKLKISSENGQHQAITSISGAWLVDIFSAKNIPLKINLISLADSSERNILSKTNPYENYKMPEIRIGTIKAADDITDLYYRLTLPIDFDSTKKYPVIIYVYGGPHVQLVQNIFTNKMQTWEYYMAQRGFLMFTLDGRASANRGKLFEKIIYKNIGKAPLEDQLRGVDFLKSLAFVDTLRIGVYGWSFGGFMSLQLLTKTPNIFKAGIAGGAVVDWRLYEVMYGERYMQTPQTNPEGYQENDITNHIEYLQAKLMLIHCELDPVVRFTNAEKLLCEIKKQGKKIKFVRYQEHEHNVLGKDRVKMYRMISNFFIKNLK